MILIFKFSHIISGLLPSNHRVEMVQKAIENYDFVKISTWEAEQKKWNRTRAVLDVIRKADEFGLCSINKI